MRHRTNCKRRTTNAAVRAHCYCKGLVTKHAIIPSTFFSTWSLIWQRKPALPGSISIICKTGLLHKTSTCTRDTNFSTIPLLFSLHRPIRLYQHQTLPNQLYKKHISSERRFHTYLAIYSQTVVRQFPYVRRSYDIDTTPFAIHETRHTYNWRKYVRWWIPNILRLPS